MKRDCPKCGKKVDWGSQIREWMKFYGKDWEEWAMISIMCFDCDSLVGEVVLEEGLVETSEVYSPALKQKVIVPERIKSVKKLVK